ncbi:UvrD-helicase domain-containing protein [Denitromonas sp.]|uniref:UvrD-helicase domain-containing protein n=1 Tax=Denitromonas sp. TaxID=2734609 RepID=UPI002AFEA985|nr:UvrD-helicase domain-containing protein [Denitromonas sp.]
MTPRSLDPLRFPLTGSQLIEASAGTGKTYTIAALYVRLVLGHGGEAAFGRALTPPEILVVTFTEAATQELRERIRRRLAEAATAFLADPATAADTPTGDALLDALRADIPPEHWPTCARRLQLAAEWMDEAAVSTIHGWCNRMLREHAFDSGSLFTQTLETDQSDLLAEVVRDYWRSHMVPLGTEAAAEVLRWWAGPEALQADLAALIGHAARLHTVDTPPAELLHRVLDERTTALHALKAPWADWVDALQALLDEARARKAFNGSKLKQNHYTDWLRKLADWRDDPDSLDPGLTDTAKARLTDAGLREVWKDGTPPQHPALDALAALDSALAALPVARNDLLCHAARWVAERFAREQQRRAQMGFDDLLTRLAAALAGPNGAALAGRIRASFPVALIDEFQDTDPVQYAIFDAIYRIAEAPADTALILIGDPKQAIYAFRGADIHTYLVARRACAGRLHTLGRNYRSTTAMVAAANRCFRFAEDRPDGAGAFLFNAMGDNPVPFVRRRGAGAQDRVLP